MAFVKKNCAPCDPAKTQEMIRERAREIWEKMGRPQGQDVTIWVKAEKEILKKMGK